MNSQSIDVLLVEDNMDDAELTIMELKKHHMANNLVHVIDGEQALEFVFSTGQFQGRQDVTQNPKLILLDIKMPKLNGMEVLKTIRENERTRAIPIVILTSSMEDPDIKRCYELGANSYIVKPVNFERFAEAIRNLGFYWLLLNQPPV
jgi:two-component system response regulator